MKTLIAVAALYAAYFGIGLVGLPPATIHKLVMML